MPYGYKSPEITRGRGKQGYYNGDVGENIEGGHLDTFQLFECFKEKPRLSTPFSY